MEITAVRKNIALIKFALDRLIDNFHDWIEWQDAKSWAKEYHPGLLHLARKARMKETRRIFRNKIVKAYQGESEQ